jgi:trans-2,3-dihydro-3-hydroxyanthranilate isomerase
MRPNWRASRHCAIASEMLPSGPRWAAGRGSGEGINEDPATGAAAGPMAVHLAQHGSIQWGAEIIIDQGAEMGRPSTLHARAVGSARRSTGSKWVGLCAR